MTVLELCHFLFPHENVIFQKVRLYGNLNYFFCVQLMVSGRKKRVRKSISESTKKIISESVSASGSSHLTTAQQVPGDKQGSAGPAAGDGPGWSLPQAQTPSPQAVGLCWPGTRGCRDPPSGVLTPTHWRQLPHITARTSGTSQDVSTLLHDRPAQPGSNCISDEILVYIGT